jgi:selenocysteine lyase/cysteine desulfurase
MREALDGWRDWQSWFDWEQDGEICRRLFAELVGAAPTEVSLQPAVSAAIGIVAASLPVANGDNVVCYENEFQSALFPWVSLERQGVEVRTAPLERLAEAVDGRTRLVAVSSVQSADGRVADLAALRATGARILVDGTQSVGAMPIELDHIDYLAVHGYKWLLCPRGLSFLWVRPELLLELEPWQAGWKSRSDPYERYYGLPRELTEDARRLDTSLPWLLAAGSRRSLELLNRLGVERIAEHDLALARRFCEGLDIPETGSPIVRVPGTEADIERLSAAGIRCAGRAGAVRFAFHLYNDEADVDLALAALRG